MAIAGARAVIGSGEENLLNGNVQFVNAAITGTNTQADTTITSVDWANTLALFAGSSNNNNYSSSSYFTQTSATNVRAIRASATSATSNLGVSLIPFKAGVMDSIQYGTVTIANGASTGAATITTLTNLASAEVAFLGQTTATNSQDYLAELDLTNSTTVTATRRGTVGATTVAFVVFQVNPTYFVARNRFTLLDHANSIPMARTTGDATAHPSSSIPVYRGKRMNGAGTMHNKAIYPISQKHLATHYLTGVVTSDDTQYKFSMVQLTTGLKTSYVSTLMSSTTTDTTIPTIDNYLKAATAYMGNAGVSGGSSEDYLDSHRSSLTSNTNLRSIGISTNSSELMNAILQFS